MLLPGGLGARSKRGTTFPSLPAMTNDYSLEFRGPGTTDGYVTIGQPADIDFVPSSSQFTISHWIKTPSAFDFERHSLCKGRFGTGSISVSFGVLPSDSTHAVAFVLCGGGENTSGGALVPDTWYMLTVTVIGGVARLYVNDTLVGVPFTVGTGQDTTTDWTFGISRYNDNSDASYPWRGHIDEVTFWNIAFSGAEVRQLYGPGAPVDPTQCNRAAYLKHWYRMGDGDSIPTITDRAGSSNGTLIATSATRLTEHSPNHTAAAIAVLSHLSGCDLHFDATDYGGSGDWYASFGNFTGSLNGTSVRSVTSQFSGRYQNSNGGWFRLPNAGVHVIDGSTVQTYVIRMLSGGEDGSGGFFLGYDDGGGGASDFQVYNLFYAEDAAARIRNTAGSDYLGAEEHLSVNANRYITIHVTIDMTIPRLRVYVNGGLIAERTSGAGTFSPRANAPLGINGVGYFGGGGYGSSANNQAIMEVARYDGVEFTLAQIAADTAAWNALKGYVY